MNDSLLVVGGNGVIGRVLKRVAKERGLQAVVTTRSGETGDMALDLEGVSDEWELDCVPASAVICAAATRIQWCEEYPERARRVNLENTVKLARRLVDAGSFVVFLSTNLVFDGSIPKTPIDTPRSPRTVYGELKAEAESAFLKLRERAAIVRLSKVFHPAISPMVDWLNRLSSGENVAAFGDYLCSPIWIDQVVEGLLAVATGGMSGLHQFSPGDETTYAEIARGLAARVGRDEAMVEEVSGRERLLGHHFPAHTALDSSTTEEKLGMQFATAAQVLDRLVDSWRSQNTMT